MGTVTRDDRFGGRCGIWRKFAIFDWRLGFERGFKSPFVVLWVRITPLLGVIGWGICRRTGFFCVFCFVCLWRTCWSACGRKTGGGGSTIGIVRVLGIVLVDAIIQLPMCPVFLCVCEWALGMGGSTDSFGGGARFWRIWM